MEIIPDESIPSCDQNKVLFKSESLNLDLRFVPESTMDNVSPPNVELYELDLTEKGHLGLSACANLELLEGQAVTFVLRTPPERSAPMRVFPTQEKAESLGVSLDSEWCIRGVLFRL